MTETLHYIRHELEGIYPDNEIQSLARIVIEQVSGVSFHRLSVDKDKQLSENQKQDIRRIVQRLKQSEPVQYILNEAWFYGLTLAVDSSVLIPRPETEELVELIVKRHKEEKPRILDIGTGSGCIAIALAKHLPGAEVWAVDVSAEALQTARRNAALNQAEVHFLQADILHPNAAELIPHTYNIIVSNPPYVLESEKAAMEKNVLEYEPGLALFVPDEAPLRFYRAIARLGKQKLEDNGFLYFEINARCGTEMISMLEEEKYRHIRLIQDIYGKDRMTQAQL